MRLRLAPLILASGVLFAATGAVAQGDAVQSKNPVPTTRPAPSPAPKPAPAPPAASPHSAAMFDGTYRGGTRVDGPCGKTTIELDVGSGRASGIGTSGKNKWTVHGTVAADGSFSGMNGTQVLTGRFRPDGFEGSYLSAVPACGRRPVTLERTSPR